MEMRQLLPRKNPKNGNYQARSIERHRLRIIHNDPILDLSDCDFNGSNLNSSQKFAGILVFALFILIIAGSFFL